jgi:Mn2+/Fe2+ NRAMP family transporter
MKAALAPFKLADLPEKTRGFWKLAGPGAILVGLSIGAGEIIVWPRIAAQYGSTMIWAAVLGVFVQLWVNIEVGRYTLATGESAFTGFCRVWYAWIAGGWIIAGCVLTFFLQRLANITFLFNAGFMGGIAMAIYVPLLLYINHKHLPRPARPSAVCTVFLVAAAALYVTFAAFSIWDVVTHWGGR